MGDRITGYFADDAYCEYVAVDPTTFAANNEKRIAALAKKAMG